MDPDRMIGKSHEHDTIQVLSRDDDSSDSCFEGRTE